MGHKKELYKTLSNKKLYKFSEEEVSLEDKLLDSNRKPKVLFFDIETTPLRAWVWRLGEQVLRHDQLDSEHDQYDIICIAYKFDNEPTKILHWDYRKQNSKKMLEEFDKIANQADIVIGKNSDRFDVKHLNALRMRYGLKGMPTWTMSTDDVEKQIRKHFAFPSYGLDYLSKTLIGTGGKHDMHLKDWIDIVEQRSQSAYDKMLRYCKKDVDDLATLWNKVSKHFKPKLNQATHYGEHCCTNCGSHDIKRNGTRVAGKTKYQFYYCNAHGGYAGKAPISPSTGGIGRIG